jgi:glycine/sarcosine N-methyltransferase
MYDTFSADYDRFVNWPARLEYELPFVQRQLESASARSVLDAACGTGMHAIALARRGYAAAGADLSAPMIVRAIENAAAAEVSVRFAPAGFGDLSRLFQDVPSFPFDALLCLGNSLPHLLSPDLLAQALADFAACLRPGGLALIQNRNFDALAVSRERWMEPQAARSAPQGEEEWIFVRFYDYRPDGLIDFNILTLHRSPGEAWKQQVASTGLRPLLRDELVEELGRAGFEGISCYGSMAGDPFDPASSGNLVVVARKSQGFIPM